MIKGQKLGCWRAAVGPAINEVCSTCWYSSATWWLLDVLACIKVWGWHEWDGTGTKSPAVIKPALTVCLVSHYRQKNSEAKRCHWMQQLWSRFRCWTSLNPEDSCVCALNGPVWFPLCSAAGPELLARWHHFMILLVYQAPFPLRPLISLLLPAVCQAVLQLCTGWCCRDHILKEKFHIFSLV